MDDKRCAGKDETRARPAVTGQQAINRERRLQEWLEQERKKRDRWSERSACNIR